MAVHTGLMNVAIFVKKCDFKKKFLNEFYFQFLCHEVSWLNFYLKELQKKLMNFFFEEIHKSLGFTWNKSCQIYELITKKLFCKSGFLRSCNFQFFYKCIELFIKVGRYFCLTLFKKHKTENHVTFQTKQQIQWMRSRK